MFTSARTVANSSTRSVLPATEVMTSNFESSDHPMRRPVANRHVRGDPHHQHVHANPRVKCLPFMSPVALYCKAIINKGFDPFYSWNSTYRISTNLRVHATKIPHSIGAQVDGVRRCNTAKRSYRRKIWYILGPDDMYYDLYVLRGNLMSSDKRLWTDTPRVAATGLAILGLWITAFINTWKTRQVNTNLLRGRRE